ncbi:MAG: STAS domain-containing protein [bacterium]|nr:STAS domain-containing protein [bacterium]
MAYLRTEHQGDVLVVAFNDGRILDESHIQNIGAELLEQVKEAPAGKMLVTFEGVGFMSSAMIGKIILLNNTCKKAKVTLKLCDIADSVLEVFKLMRLTKILDIQPNVEKGLASFEKKGWFG